MGDLTNAKTFYDLYLRRYLAQPAGASETEIVALEDALGARLPAAYREYLLWMGQDRDGVFRGSNCFVGDVAGNGHSLRELAEENDVDLGDRHPIVFFMHGGYTAAWFDQRSTDADPRCEVFNEGDSDGIKPAGQFSDWLMAELRGALATQQRLSTPPEMS